MQTVPRNLATREVSIHEPTINCPHCHQDIRLTESLAAPLLKNKEIEFKHRESELRDREAALRRDRESVEVIVADRLVAERGKVAEEEQRKARLAIGIELEQRQREKLELEELLKVRDAKLAEAQQAQADIVRQQRTLQDEKREMDLIIERRVSAGTGQIQQKAKQEAEEQQKLKLAEREQVIQSMQKQLDEMRRKSEQGSQQLQGEVLEQELESILAGNFVHDTVMRVPKGELGGDVVQRVLSSSGVICGTILWESKRTRKWSDAWLPKLREDQRAAKAEIAVLVTQALPKDVINFALIDGVYVVSPQCALPVAMLLRNALLELAIARQSAEGRQTKATLIYEYLTGPRFRQRIQGIVEAFSSMQDDLNAEKKTTLKQWAKRETQLDRLMNSTVGMYGDLQGIAGRSLAEIEGMSVLELGNDAAAV